MVKKLLIFLKCILKKSKGMDDLVALHFHTWHLAEIIFQMFKYDWHFKLNTIFKR